MSLDLQAEPKGASRNGTADGSSPTTEQTAADDGAGSGDIPMPDTKEPDQPAADATAAPAAPAAAAGSAPATSGDDAPATLPRMSSSMSAVSFFDTDTAQNTRFSELEYLPFLHDKFGPLLPIRLPVWSSIHHTQCRPASAVSL